MRFYLNENREYPWMLQCQCVNAGLMFTLNQIYISGIIPEIAVGRQKIYSHTWLVDDLTDVIGIGVNMLFFPSHNIKALYSS